jgi:HAE1 family hydrophobic/amphiphilic exporter-1
MTLGIMKQGIIGKELISTGDQGKFKMALEFDKTTVHPTKQFDSSKDRKSYIIQQPEVKTVFSNVGGPSTGIGSLGVGAANKTEFTIQLKMKNEELLKKNLPKIL